MVPFSAAKPALEKRLAAIAVHSRERIFMAIFSLLFVGG